MADVPNAPACLTHLLECTLRFVRPGLVADVSDALSQLLAEMRLHMCMCMHVHVHMYNICDLASLATVHVHMHNICDGTRSLCACVPARPSLERSWRCVWRGEQWCVGPALSCAVCGSVTRHAAECDASERYESTHTSHNKMVRTLRWVAGKQMTLQQKAAFRPQNPKHRTYGTSTSVLACRPRRVAAWEDGIRWVGCGCRCGRHA